MYESGKLAQDVTPAPERGVEYLEWARRVVEGCRGTNEELEKYFDERVVIAAAANAPHD